MDAPDHTPGSWREWRGLQVCELKQQGRRQRVIAEALGASEVSFSRRLTRVREGSVESLRVMSGAGQPPKISDSQKRLIPKFLWHGAEAYGFQGHVWICGRIAKIN